jgi:hypothetical protein
MATSYDIIHKTVMGNKRVHIVSMSMDAASANVETGLSVIHAVAFAPVSMATAAIGLRRNIGSGSTARAGILNIGSCVSGDVFNITVYGV